MQLRINKTELKVILLLLASIQIDSIPYILPSLAMIFNLYLPLAVCALMTVLLLMRKRISATSLIIISYFALLVAITFIQRQNNFQLIIRQIVSPLAVTLVTEYYLQKKPQEYFSAAIKLLIALTVIDIITIILYPNGLYATETYTDCWFLGYKTARLRTATLPIIMMAAVVSVQKYSRLDRKFWLITSLAFVDTLLSKNTGGVVTIAAMVIMLFLTYSPKSSKNRLFAVKFFSSKWLIFGIIALTFLVNVLQNLSLFAPFFELIEQKNTSIMARVRIWNASLDYFSQSPFIGSGYISSSEFSAVVGFPHATQPHSLLMSVLVYSGLIGMALYMILIYRSFSRVNSHTKNSASVVCAIHILCIMIHGIISIHLFSPFFYASMVMAYYLGNIDTQNQLAQNQLAGKQPA